MPDALRPLRAGGFCLGWGDGGPLKVACTTLQRSLWSPAMKDLLFLLLSIIPRLFRSHTALEAEILLLRHRLLVYQRLSQRRPLRPTDRLFWSWLSGIWPGWRDALVFVQPETVLAWRRRKFREHWARLSCGPKPGRPKARKEVRELIQGMSAVNPLWGSSRILGEIRRLGIELARSTVERYMVRRPRPRSQGWMTFLRNRLREMVAIGFFVMPTARFKLLYVLVVMAHFRRQVVHFKVTTNPTAQRAAQQILEALPWDKARRYLLRERHATYGHAFRKRVGHMGIEEVRTAPRSPWQNPYVERLIGSIRRECLDNVIMLNGRHPRRVLKGYFDHHQRWRTHLSLAMDCPQPRAVQRPSVGDLVELLEVGRLYHHYEPRAA